MKPLLHRTISSNGIRMHVAEQGEGPLVVLCHGFPESWYTWRHQLQALSDAGFRALAPDMRGYGQTDAPLAVGQYTQLHLVGDMLGLLDAYETERALIVGHDWGAAVAWNAALMRPDRFHAVAAMSMPFAVRGEVSPTAALRESAKSAFNYMLYFQAEGVAERELSESVQHTMRSLLYSASAEGAHERRAAAGVPRDGKFLQLFVDPGRDPAWLPAEDFAFYVKEFQRTGFRGGLNWYRTMDLSWELMAPFRGARVTVPALFIAGDQDTVVVRGGRTLEDLPKHVPNLTRTVILPSCGHWTPEELPVDVSALLVSFAREFSA